MCTSSTACLVGTLSSETATQNTGLYRGIFGQWKIRWKLLYIIIAYILGLYRGYIADSSAEPLQTLLIGCCEPHSGRCFLLRRLHPTPRSMRALELRLADAKEFSV